MGSPTKPYKRFRARGGAGDGGGDGLDALRELRAREAGAAAAPPPRAPAPPPRAPEPRPEPGPVRPGRGRTRAPGREERGRRSLRGIGPGGWAWRIGLVLLIGLVAWAGFGLLALNGAVSEANGKVSPAARAALDDPPGGMLGTPTNTLVVGADALRGQTRSRADTILIMRTDPDAGRIRYLSIPRDFRVELPGVGTEKINAAFYYGGQRGIINAVRRLTGVPIHHIMVLKFPAFERMVDALGGVSVNNPTAIENCPYPGGRTVSFPRGRLELDGTRALEFARVRRCDDDLRRAMRQQALLSGMRGEVLSLGNLWRAPWQGADVVRELHTDIGTIDMVKFGWLQARLDQLPEDRIILSGEPQTIGGISFIVQTDPDRNEREIARFMGQA